MRKNTRNKFIKIIFLCLPIVGLIAVASWYLSRPTIALLEPAGQIGLKEKDLMLVALALAAVVVIPVYIITILIVIKYRESNHENKSVKYNPDWDHNRALELLWWGIPIIIITILSIITWNSSHALDPFKPIDTNQPALNIQVVAMDWKWLFIYPGQQIASVNLAEIPVGEPVDFYITSDTVMNSFWVPQLGGQIYAMPGMSTQMHLQADKIGDFNGWSANISGEGFASMTFLTKSVTSNNFSKWVQLIQKSSNKLTMNAYEQLSKPSIGSSIRYYSLVQAGLYNDVIMKYMTPGDGPALPTSGGYTSSNTSMPEMSSQ